MSKEQSLEKIFQQVPDNKKKLFELLEIGRTKGFGNFINRKHIWPFLLSLNSQKIRQSPVYQWKKGMNRQSNDFDQLEKDAKRSLSSMRTFQDITKFHLRKKQEAVLSVLDTFFAKNSDLRYIQGFHDVASIFLILFGNSTGYYLMEKAGRTYFYDFLAFEFGDVGKAVSRIVYDLIVSEDPEFKKIFSSFEQTEYLIFIVPWILTWFAHNFTSVKTICRIWDYLFCTGPYGVFYLTAGIIISTKSELLDSCEELDDPSIQTFYQEQIRKQSLKIEVAIEAAIALQQKIDIEKTAGYAQLNQNSMFRYQNFSRQINVHKEYREQKSKNKKRKQNLWKVLKIGGTIIVTVAVLAVIKHQRIRLFGQL